MAGPQHSNPTDKMMRIRTHAKFIDRIRAVAMRNGRTVSSESLYAIRQHVEAEEKRLGLTPMPEHQNAQLNETPAVLQVPHHGHHGVLRAPHHGHSYQPVKKKA